MHPLCTNNPEFDDRKIVLEISEDEYEFILQGLSWYYSETSDESAIDLQEELRYRVDVLPSIREKIIEESLTYDFWHYRYMQNGEFLDSMARINYRNEKINEGNKFFWSSKMSVVCKMILMQVCFWRFPIKRK